MTGFHCSWACTAERLCRGWISFCWLGTESSCALGGSVSPAQSWGQEGRHLLQIWTRIRHPEFHIQSDLSGHLSQKYLFWKAPQVGVELVKGGREPYVQEHNLVSTETTTGDKCNPDLGQSADREEGWMLQFPIPTQAAECILHGPWPPRSGGSSSSFPLAHPAVTSPSPAARWPHRRNNSQACQVGLVYFWIILYIVQYIKIQSTQKKFTVSKAVIIV